MEYLCATVQRRQLCTNSTSLPITVTVIVWRRRDISLHDRKKIILQNSWLQLKTGLNIYLQQLKCIQTVGWRKISFQNSPFAVSIWIQAGWQPPIKVIGSATHASAEPVIWTIELMPTYIQWKMATHTFRTCTHTANPQRLSIKSIVDSRHSRVNKVWYKIETQWTSSNVYGIKILKTRCWTAFSSCIWRQFDSTKHFCLWKGHCNLKLRSISIGGK